jgi:hypothetical protein
VPDRVLLNRANLGVATRRGDPKEIDAARVALTEAKLERHIRQALAAAPPLDQAMKDRLACLLRPGVARP